VSWFSPELHQLTTRRKHLRYLKFIFGLDCSQELKRIRNQFRKLKKQEIRKEKDKERKT